MFATTETSPSPTTEGHTDTTPVAAAAQAMLQKVSRITDMIISPQILHIDAMFQHTTASTRVDTIMRSCATLAFHNHAPEPDGRQYLAFLDTIAGTAAQAAAQLRQAGATFQIENPESWTLRKADDALSWDGGSLSLHCKEMPLVFMRAPALRQLANQLASLRSIIAGYRFVMADYDMSNPQERAFWNIAHLLTYSTHSHFDTLLRIARDQIKRVMQTPGATIAIATQPCGSGVATSLFMPEAGEGNAYAHIGMDGTELVFQLHGSEWRRITHADLSRLAMEYSQPAMEAVAA